MQQTYERWQKHTLEKTLLKRRVLNLTGPRQCGKTTLVKGLAKPNTIYRTLDDPTFLNAALSDPQGFVQHDGALMIIDEVQRAPVLLQTIKQNVDDDDRPGRFLLTGSANIQSLPTVSESLAGRISTIRLRPLSLGEVSGKKPDFLQKAFDQNLQDQSNNSAQRPEDVLGHAHHPTWNKDAYLAAAFQGGFPEVRRLDDHSDRRGWHKDYMGALIQRDLQDIAHVKRKESIAQLVDILAAWSSKFMNLSSIGKTLSLAQSTVETYLNALELLYVVERVRPWHKTDYDRAGKQAKFFFGDTGMMASLLGWRFDQVRFDGDMNGKILETFVFNQLSSHLDLEPYDYTLSHYRDREKREVDFVIERADGAILGIEVKSGTLIDQSMFRHLIWFRDHIVPDRPFVGLVLYTGQHMLSFGPHLWAVPIRFLWS